MPNAYLSAQRLDQVLPESYFAEIFARVKLNNDDFNPENFKPGSSGQKQLYDRLVQDTKLDENVAWKNS